MSDINTTIKNTFPEMNFSQGDVYSINGKNYVYGSDGNFTLDAASSTESEDKKDTPKKWDSKPDARSLPGAGKYPNYYSHKTRSGHVFMMDDSNGAEHVTIQHRQGSCIQFLPDGAIQFTSQNGQYNIIFGENRIMVTGAQDIVVQGSASLKVDGDYNVRVDGNTNFNVKGDFNLVSKNFNQLIGGNIDIQAKNRTEKVEGSIVSEASGGNLNLIAGNGLSLKAKSGVGVRAGSFGLNSDSFVALKAGSSFDLKAGTKAGIQAAGKFSVKADGGTGIDGGLIKFNSQYSDDVGDAVQMFALTAPKVPST